MRHGSAGRGRSQVNRAKRKTPPKMPTASRGTAMIDRRRMMSAAACLAGAPLLAPRAARASTAMTYDEAVRATYAPLRTDHGLLEAIRYATLAANSHNTQPWKFRFEPNVIIIAPDFTRRCPAVDPDDHHLFAKSRRCRRKSRACGWRDGLCGERRVRRGGSAGHARLEAALRLAAVRGDPAPAVHARTL